MANLDNQVVVTVQVNNSGVATESFGTIGILSHNATFSGRSQYWSSVASAINGGWDPSSPEIRALSAILAQSPHPTEVAFLRANDYKPTQRYLMTFSEADNTQYEVTIKGQGFDDADMTYTTATGATLGQIVGSFYAQLLAIDDANFTPTLDALTFSPTTFTAGSFALNELTATAHGRSTGDGPVTVANAGGALPSGLLTATDYWVVKIDANTFKLSTTLANAIAVPPVVVALADAGTGTQTMSDTGSSVAPVTGNITLTANAPGDWFAVEQQMPDLITLIQNHADPGLASALAAIVAKDNTWYYLHTMYNSKEYVEAGAGFIESTTGAGSKFYRVDTCYTASVETVLTDATDTLAALLALSYKRTEYNWSAFPSDMYSAGLTGLLAPKNVGTWTAKFKTVSGARPNLLNDTQTANLEARRANSYDTEAGRDISWEGQLGNAVYGFTDVTVCLDYVINQVQTAAFGVQVSLDKIGFTDEDIDQVAGAIRGVILNCTSDAHPIMMPGDPNDPTNPPPSITFPRVADIDPSVRALRELPDGQLTFTLQGAVHKIFVNATVSF